jgi:hypothetical protein
LEAPDPDDDPELERPLRLPEDDPVPDREPPDFDPLPPDFDALVESPRAPRCCWAWSIMRDMNPLRRFGSGAALRPSAMACSSRVFARITKCCWPICQRFEVVQ